MAELRRVYVKNSGSGGAGSASPQPILVVTSLVPLKRELPAWGKAPIPLKDLRTPSMYQTQTQIRNFCLDMISWRSTLYPRFPPAFKKCKQCYDHLHFCLHLPYIHNCLMEFCPSTFLSSLSPFFHSYIVNSAHNYFVLREKYLV